MAITGAIVAAVSTGAQMVEANQQRQDAKGAAAKAVASAPNADADALKANVAASAAAQRQKNKTANAKGFTDTILTGPSNSASFPGDTGVTAPIPGRGHATLLGG